MCSWSPRTELGARGIATVRSQSNFGWPVTCPSAATAEISFNPKPLMGNTGILFQNPLQPPILRGIRQFWMAINVPVDPKPDTFLQGPLLSLLSLISSSNSPTDWRTTDASSRVFPWSMLTSSLACKHISQSPRANTSLTTWFAEKGSLALQCNDM